MHIIIDDWLHVEFKEEDVAKRLIRNANSLRLDLAFVIDEKLSNSTSLTRGEDVDDETPRDDQVEQEIGAGTKDDIPNSYMSLLPTVYTEMRSYWTAFEPPPSIDQLLDSIDDYLNLNAHCTISRLKNQDLDFIVCYLGTYYVVCKR
jgi:hypothetical protein